MKFLVNKLNCSLKSFSKPYETNVNTKSMFLLGMCFKLGHKHLSFTYTVFFKYYAVSKIFWAVAKALLNGWLLFQVRVTHHRVSIIFWLLDKKGAFLHVASVHCLPSQKAPSLYDILVHRYGWFPPQSSAFRARPWMLHQCVWDFHSLYHPPRENHKLDWLVKSQRTSPLHKKWHDFLPMFVTQTMGWQKWATVT